MDQQRPPQDPRAGALSSRLQRGPDSGVWGVPTAPGLAGVPPPAPTTIRCPACGANNPTDADNCVACGLVLLDPLEHDTVGGSTKIGLRKGQQLYIQSRCLGWMSANVAVTPVAAPHAWQGFGAAEGRAPLPIYLLGVTANVGRLELGTALPGTIHVMQVGKGAELLVKTSSFLAAQDSVTLGSAYNLERPQAALSTGTVVQAFSGHGLMFIEVCGETVVHSLQPDEVLKVNTANLAFMDASVRFTIGSAPFTDIETVDLLGPGRVWLQTHALQRVYA